VITLLVLPFRVVGAAGKVGFASGRIAGRTARYLGWRRLSLVVVGIGIGLLLAPVPGAELRRRIGQRLGDLGGTPPVDLADRVRDELASSPRTWHLPQPAVAIEAGRVVLTGDVPHATAAADLERTVAAIRGVVEVDNRLTVKGA
jgi:hypothetical protein